jgi:hypothetical protein
MHAKAEQAFRELCPAEITGRVLRTEYDSRDGTLVVYAGLTDAEADADPLELLRRNLDPLHYGIEAPLIYDSATGRPARRMIFPYRLWSNAERMKAAVRVRDREEGPWQKHSGLRLMKGIPEEAAEHTYGRSGRLCLLLDRALPLLAVEVIPGGLREYTDRPADGGIRRAAWVILARSGVSTGHRAFHMLRAHFMRVERAAVVPEPVTREALKLLERDLLREAEEDCRIMTALLRTDVSWLHADVNPNP